MNCCMVTSNHFTSLPINIGDITNAQLCWYDSPFTKETSWEPEEEEELVCWFQGESKVIACLALVHEKALTVRWMEDKGGPLESVIHQC